jgi:malic enzyme
MNCSLNLFFFFVIQSNNAYIFPGFGLGLIMSGTIRVHDDLLLAACKCIRDSKIPFNIKLN